MSRPAEYGSVERLGDPVAYNRDLYGRSERERLRRINYARTKRGQPLASSLAEVALRRPMNPAQ